jgi:hypothetical protein
MQRLESPASTPFGSIAAASDSGTLPLFYPMLDLRFSDEKATGKVLL